MIDLTHPIGMEDSSFFGVGRWQTGFQGNASHIVEITEVNLFGCQKLARR